MSEITSKKAARKPTARSRVTNGKLGDMDGRGKWARRFADLIDLYSQDITNEPAFLPETVKSVIRRAATMTVELEMAESTFAKDGKAEPAALAAYQTTANSLHRLLQTLQTSSGSIAPLHRPASPITLTVKNGRFIREPRSTDTIGGRIAHGSAVGDRSREADRRLARAIAFTITNAIRTGSPLPDAMARIAVESGMAEYAEDQSPIIDHDISASPDVPASGISSIGRHG